jgi:hypothetical protein
MIRITTLEGHLENIEDKISSLETLLKERMEAQKLAVNKATEANDIRLDAMNQFREQLSEERALFVTRDMLQAELKTVRAEIESVKSILMPLQKSQSYNRGRDSMAAALVAGALSAVALLVSIIRLFTTG